MNEKGRFTGPRILSFTAHDPDEINESLREWDLHYTQLSCGKFEGSIFLVNLADAQIGQAFYAQSIINRGSHTLDTVGFGLSIKGSSNAKWGCKSFSGKELLILESGEEIDLHTCSEYGIYAIAIDKQAFEEAVYSSGYDNVSKIINGTTILELGNDSYRSLISFLTKFFNEISSNYPLCHSPHSDQLISANLKNALITAVFASSFPNGNKVKRSSERNYLALKRADEFMEEHIRDPISVFDLAYSACVSVRTLEYSFKEFYGVSPMKYLKIKRLHKVNKELKSANQKFATITNVAHKSGFRHMGQFAIDYKRFFGESPSETFFNRHKIWKLGR